MENKAKGLYTLSRKLGIPLRRRSKSPDLFSVPSAKRGGTCGEMIARDKGLGLGLRFGLWAPGLPATHSLVGAQPNWQRTSPFLH